MGGSRRRTGSLRLTLAAALVAAWVGTGAGARPEPFHANVDPSLRAGEVALVHTSAGLAGALSATLAELGAVEIRTAHAANTVVARLSGDALEAIKTDRRVALATRDTAIVASGGREGTGYVAAETDREAPSSSDTEVALIAIGAPAAWSTTTGRGSTVAILDTGIGDHPDLARRTVVARADFVRDGAKGQDPAGHGTFVAGIIAANGGMKGVAPDARLVSLRVLDGSGNGTMAAAIGAVEWLLRHRNAFDVDVVNMSWGAPQATSYHNDLLSALVEALWFSGMTVVAAAGNSGGAVTSPGSDPFVITAGSFGDQGTASLNDDRESLFSSRGATLDGFAKPDTLAPGQRVTSLRVRGVVYLDNNGDPVGSPADLYVRMSGTSASTAFVSGVAALVASANPSYRPNKIKGAIVASGRAIPGASARGVDAATALTAMTTVNAGIGPSLLLLKLVAGAVVKLRGVTWEGVTWESVSWETVSWETVSWETVSWETVSWETVTWEGTGWMRVVAE